MKVSLLVASVLVSALTTALVPAMVATLVLLKAMSVGLWALMRHRRPGDGGGVGGIAVTGQVGKHQADGDIAVGGHFGAAFGDGEIGGVGGAVAARKVAQGEAADSAAAQRVGDAAVIGHGDRRGNGGADFHGRGGDAHRRDAGGGGVVAT